MLKRLIRNRKGQGLVEYALIIAGVTLICAVGIAIFGHKVSDMISATAVILPGAYGRQRRHRQRQDHRDEQRQWRDRPRHPGDSERRQHEPVVRQHGRV